LSLVSVIIPTHNRAHLIERAVQSVLKQTYDNIEVIVVDDCSTDNTDLIVDKLSSSDNRVKSMRHSTNFGAQVARNSGIKAAKGEFVAFLDSDNEWLSEKLQKQMTLFQESSDKVGVVYAGYFQEFNDGCPKIEHKPRHQGSIYKIALREWVADTNSLVIRKQILQEVGLFDERVRANQEWDLCIRLAKLVNFAHVSEPLSIYHMHSGPTISKDLLLSAKGYLDVITLHNDEILTQLGKKALSNHFLIAGNLFVQALDFESAKSSFWNAIKLWPISFKAIIYFVAAQLGESKYQQLILLKRQLKKLAVYR